MAVLSVIPSTNLRWRDLRDTLNAHGGRVTNLFQSAFLDGSVAIRRPDQSVLYPDAKVNIWAKYRPVCHSNVIEVTDNERAQAGAGFRWTEYDEQTNPNGMIMSLEDMAQLVGDAYWDAENNGIASLAQKAWQIRMPFSANENTQWPLRIGDYRGYNPTTENPLFDYAQYGVINPSGHIKARIIPIIGGGQVRKVYNLYKSTALKNASVLGLNPYIVDGHQLDWYQVGMMLVNLTSYDIAAIAINLPNYGFVTFNFTQTDEDDDYLPDGTYGMCLFLSPRRTGVSIDGTVINPTVSGDARYDHDDFILVDGSFCLMDVYNGYNDIIVGWDSEQGQEYQYPYWLPSPSQSFFFGDGVYNTSLELYMGPELEDVLEKEEEIWWKMTLGFQYDSRFTINAPFMIQIPVDGSGDYREQPDTEYIDIPLYFADGYLKSYYIDPDHFGKIPIKICSLDDGIDTYDGELVVYCNKPEVGQDMGKNIIYAFAPSMMSQGREVALTGNIYNKGSVQNPPFFKFGKPINAFVQSMELEILNSEVNP